MQRSNSSVLMNSRGFFDAVFWGEIVDVCETALPHGQKLQFKLHTSVISI